MNIKQKTPISKETAKQRKLKALANQIAAMDGDTQELLAEYVALALRKQEQAIMN
jgi:hypothetical protein|tara:strand:+ start:7253 stop:7417 length:165 start_codon:yes stop_codon:yes gene_type:complete